MEIAIIADDNKKELLAQFCTAYSGILSKHNIYATGSTGTFISNVSGLNIVPLLSGAHGGLEQLTSRVAYDEIDLLLFFRDAELHKEERGYHSELFLACDTRNIPFATNIATAEVLVRALDRGDLDWREIVNPRTNKRNNY
ncbi:MAG: methylglyoxal synthase [Ruminococcaceae bacterium]|nr:methylglyoxal synthase [Oscillospiraceae bacterium]